MMPKTIAVSILLLIGWGTQALAKDGFEKVSCNADIAKALIGQRAANERIVVIEARHKDLGLKDLGSNESYDKFDRDFLADLRQGIHAARAQQRPMDHL